MISDSVLFFFCGKKPVGYYQGGSGVMGPVQLAKTVPEGVPEDCQAEWHGRLKLVLEEGLGWPTTSFGSTTWSSTL